MKELIVSALDQGTVINHIPSKSVWEVVKILGLEHFDHAVFIGMNLYSEKLGNKGIIKVRNKFFKAAEINKISLVAPQATLTIIEDYNVKSKTIVKVPDKIIGIVQCPNAKCITNHEKIETRFDVVSKKGQLQLKCHYCEKVAEKDEIKVL